MISVLIVDDELEKVRMLAQALLEIDGLGEADIDVAADVASAKRRLGAKLYDLLLLDINLPARIDRPPSVGGGLSLIRWFRAAGGHSLPRHVIGITAYADSFGEALSEFQNFVWHLVPFSYEDVSWKDKLKASVEVIILLSNPPYPSDGVTYRCDLAVVVALEEELRGVLALPAEWREVSVRNDQARYFRGRFLGDGKKLEVVAAAAANKGLPFAAVTATKLIYSFWPRYLAMTGICAGVAGRVGMGDIVAADPCWDWGSGKLRAKKNGGDTLHPAPYQIRMREELRLKLVRFREKIGSLENVAGKWPGERPQNALRIHVGAMASGASVLESGRAVGSVVEQHKDLLAIEMEAFSVLCAGEFGPEPKPVSFCLKSVCDFGDEQKGDSFHKFAAHFSATVLYEFALAELV